LRESTQHGWERLTGIEVPVNTRLTTRDAAMSAAHACNAVCAVTAAHQALTRTHRRMRAVLHAHAFLRRMRIVRAIAAGIEMHLGLGGAHGAEYERGGEE
jgi:hypothetical protein